MSAHFKHVGDIAALTSGEGGAGVPQPRTPALLMPPKHSDADAHGFDGIWLVRMRAAIERLEALVRRSRIGVAGEAGLERLFCTVCVLSAADFPLRQILAALPANEIALDADGLLSALGRLGFHAFRQRGHASLPEGAGPALFVAPNGEAVLIFSCPDSGRLKKISGEGEIEDVDSWRSFKGGTFWRFSREDETDPLSKIRRGHTGHSWFRALTSKFDRIGLGLLITSLAVAGTSVLLPLFTIQIYVHVISLGSLTPLPYFVLGMMLAIVLEALLLAQRTRILAWIANRLEFLVSTASFERLLKVRPTISERAAVTDQAARLRTLENVREFITGPAATSLLEVLASFASLAIIALLAGWLALIPFIGICMHLGLFLLLRRRARVMTSIAAEESTEMQRITIEMLEKRDAICQAGLQHLWSQRLVRGARRQQTAQMSLRLVGAMGEAFSTFILTVATILLLASGVEAVWAGTLGTGGLLAATILGLRALAPSHVLCLSVQRFEQLRNSINQLNGLMEIQPERDETREYARMRPIEGAVSFLNTGFRAGDTRPVFVGLDLEVNPGSIIAITGANGTGKTTILKLIQGMADLSIGAIRIDGVDLRQLPQEELRRRIAYVPQNPKLFPGTLRDNLLFANPFASEEKVRAVLQKVGLSSHLAQLDGGIQFRVKDSEGADFSSEFLFKFAIAQAILTESAILLIDEIPNMLLDGEIGELIRSLALSYRRRGTLFLVSHRSDFLLLADRVVALRYGKVPLVSSPDALFARVA